MYVCPQTNDPFMYKVTYISRLNEIIWWEQSCLGHGTCLGISIAAILVYLKPKIENLNEYKCKHLQYIFMYTFCSQWNWFVIADQPRATVLQYVNVPLVDYVECSALYSGVGVVLHGQICAGDVANGGVDACSVSDQILWFRIIFKLNVNH